MTAAELRHAIDTDLAAQDASRLDDYQALWLTLRSQVHTAYWPIIEDRLNALAYYA